MTSTNFPRLISTLIYVQSLLLLAFFWSGASEAAAKLSDQDKSDIARLENFLNEIGTLRSRFIQVSATGGLTSGNFWLSRPGRLRFEYDPPAPYLILANTIWLIFIDTELNQPQHWPVQETPLSVLLADHISLTKSTRIESIARRPGQISVTLRHKARPDDGTITLLFSDSPLILRQWRVVNMQGETTTVTLDQIERGVQLPIDLFIPPAEFRPEIAP